MTSATRPVEGEQAPEDPNAWCVIGLLTGGLLVLSGWTANLAPQATDEPRLMGKHAAALLMCAIAAALCAWVRLAAGPGRMGRIAGTLAFLALGGAAWAIANGGHSAWV